MQQFQTDMDVIGNNISNSNTTGYKSGRAEFADALSQTLQSSTAATATTSGIEALQVGTGVKMQSVTNDFSQGSINTTTVASNLAISGDGFFVVKDPVNGTNYVTRAGDFRVDSNGYLVTSKGMRVQGYSDSALSTLGDIQIDATGSTSTTASYKDYSIDSQGQVNVRMTDGTSFVRGQVLLQTFRDPQALVKQGDNLYAGIDDAGPLGGAGSATAAAAGTSGLGLIQSQALEASNVDLTQEFANMISSQRAFQANARVITTSDEILQEIVGLKR